LVAKPSGFLLEPIGWEDIPASKAERTQEVINSYVDAADIFIGILNRRFGNPTGVAESGTEEEYNRVEKRWQKEGPQPEIMIYFKKLPRHDLADPGEQLRKVLGFKKRISNTVLYKEFDGLDELSEKIEDALAAWIYGQRDFAAPVMNKTGVDTFESMDIEVLGGLVKRPDACAETVEEVTHYSLDRIHSSILRLQRHGLATKHDRMIRPSNSAEGFLSIVRLLIGTKQWPTLLQSDYYNRMLKMNLRDLIAARFHCAIDTKTVDLLRKLALVSPGVASYVLFGDTTLYDNLAEHAGSMGGKYLSLANDIMTHSILHHVLLRYAEDSSNSKTLDTLEGRSLSGEVITVKVSAAFQDGLAFRALSKMPLTRASAAGDIKKGHMLSGPPSIRLQIATTLFHMREFDLALRELDKALSPGNPPKVRAAALNNKGLILLERQQFEEAIQLFREATKLDPGLAEAQENLVIAQSRYDSETSTD
jgi:hypothetical protein